jgi:hypothetical protein
MCNWDDSRPFSTRISPVCGSRHVRASLMKTKKDGPPGNCMAKEEIQRRAQLCKSAHLWKRLDFDFPAMVVFVPFPATGV